RGRHGVKTPQLLSGLGIVRTEETFFFLISLAVAETFDHFPVDDKRPARVAVALTDFRTPNNVALSSIERNHTIAACKVELVLINRNASHCDVRTQTIFPDDLSRRSVDGLHNAAGVGEINDPAVNDRRGLIRSTLVHGRHEDQLQILYVLWR